jgi:hypothetical protein
VLPDMVEDEEMNILNKKNQYFIFQLRFILFLIDSSSDLFLSVVDVNVISQHANQIKQLLAQ